MSFDNFFGEADTSEVYDLIKRRRLQLIIHSAIYYHFNTNIVSDNVYDGWTKQLVELHKENPEYSDRFDEYFVNWEGETGYHFPKDEDVISKAQYLLRVHEFNDDRGVPRA